MADISAREREMLDIMTDMRRRLARLEAQEYLTKAYAITAFVTTSTWTPAITGSTGNPTITYTEAVGKYTDLFGILCFYSYRVTINAYSGGSGDLRVSIPFTCANTSNADLVRATPSLSGLDAPTGAYGANFRPQPGQAYGIFQYNVDNASAINVAIADAASGDILGAAGFFWH